MVDDTMVCMEGMTTSSSGHFHHHHHLNVNDTVDDNDKNNNGETTNKKVQKNEKVNIGEKRKEGEKKEIRECRICQEEDDHHSLEAPCACNGTLKFAHRICIQKWCNKKGDITCEICNQVFTPNYSIPPPRPNPDVMAVDISQMWGHHFGLHQHHLLTLSATERQLLDSEYNTEYGVVNVGNISCLRSIAVILMFVLLIHQVLIISRDFGLVPGYSAFFHFQVSFLQIAGFLLPCCALIRSWYILHTRRRRQG